MCAFHSKKDQHKNKYCLKCIGLGRVDSMPPLKGTEPRRKKERCDYVLNFELTNIQKEASKKIVSAVRERRHLLLHAVTGAGKTEIIFEGIKYARRSEEHTSELQSRGHLVCRLLLEKKKSKI